MTYVDPDEPDGQVGRAAKRQQAKDHETTDSYSREAHFDRDSLYRYLEMGGEETPRERSDRGVSIRSTTSISRAADDRRNTCASSCRRLAVCWRLRVTVASSALSSRRLQMTTRTSSPAWTISSATTETQDPLLRQIQRLQQGSFCRPTVL